MPEAGAHRLTFRVLRNTILPLSLVGALTTTQATAETFDLATFTPLPGYQKGPDGKDAVVYRKVKGGTYCIMNVYRSAPGSGDVKADFQAEWQSITTPLKPGTPQQEQGAAKGGWQNMAGGALFKNDGQNALVLMSTYSGYGRRVSVVLLANDQKCVDDLDRFLGTLNLSKPAATAPASQGTAPPGTYRNMTTTFKDSWVATAMKDWVEVRRGTTTVRLHYLVPYTDRTRNLDDRQLMEYFWNLLVQPHAPASEIQVRPPDDSYNRVSFAEADSTDPTTGQPIHVTLQLTSENGNARCIEIVTPTRAAFQQAFPSSDAISAMNGYNKFAVAASDLPGTWENSSSAYGMYYSTVTGDFAGMRGASTYDKFVFDRNGAYSYTFIGTSTGTGAPAVSTGKSSGRLTLDGWNATTKDTEGKSTTYTIQFEAIRGGRILHLQNTKYSGLRYDLVRTK